MVVKLLYVGLYINLLAVSVHLLFELCDKFPDILHTNQNVLLECVGEVREYASGSSI